MLGPGGSNDNQVTWAFFHHIIDEATSNRMTSLKTIVPNFFDAMCSQRAHLSSPAAVSGRTSSQGASQLWTTEAAGLPRRFAKTFLECSVIPDSNWLKCLNQDRTKTAEDLDALLLCPCMFLPRKMEDRTAEKELYPFSTSVCLCHGDSKL